LTDPSVGTLPDGARDDAKRARRPIGAYPPIYLLTGEFPPRLGGISDYTARLAESLVGMGLQVTVLVGRDHPLEPSVVPEGVGLVRLRSTVSEWKLLPAVAALLGGEAAIVHIQYQTAAFGMHPAIAFLPSWLCWRCPSVRSVVTCHDVRPPYLFPKAGQVRSLVTHRLIDSCHAAIFSDDQDRQWAGSRPNHALIPIGSGVPMVPLERSPDTTASLFELGYFGFMNASKGVETLLGALNMLVQERRSVRLTLIGDSLGDADRTNAETRAAVDAAIHRFGLSDSIIRTGALGLGEVSAALQRCDLLVFPFDDGATLRRSSLTAALAHARPVITTSRPDGSSGLRGFVHGESVLLVPPGDPRALARAIADLMDNPVRRERIAEGARLASHSIQWPDISRAIRDVYASVLGDFGAVGAAQ
jgi:glycosyltransferase involved in cell wall biosynthesis